jgi:putative endonuclease
MLQAHRHRGRIIRIMASMYILRCSNGTYYTGSTDDLKRRLIEHSEGRGSNYTRKYLPVELVYREDFDSVDEAFSREKQVQNWSRAKKEALIRGDYKHLSELSRSSCPGPSTSSGTADVRSVVTAANAKGISGPDNAPQVGSADAEDQ